MDLVQRLLQRGVLKEADAARVKEAEAAVPTKRLHELLIEKGFAQEEQVLSASCPKSWAWSSSI